MKTELNVAERATIMEMLPQEGSFLTLRLLRELSGKVGLSAIEIEEFGVVQSENRISWNEKGNVPKAFEFARKEEELVVKALNKLDSDGKLTQRHFSLFEKFIGDSDADNKGAD